MSDCEGQGRRDSYRVSVFTIWSELPRIKMCEHLVEFMMSESVIDGVRNGEIEELIHVQAGRQASFCTCPLFPPSLTKSQ